MTTPQYISDQSDRLRVSACVGRLEPAIPTISERFYEHLAQFDPEANAALKGSASFRQRKFANLFMTFRSLKYLERLEPVLREMGERHRGYHRQFRLFLPSMRQALLETLRDMLGAEFTPELARAWERVYHDVAMIMREAGSLEEPERRSLGNGSWRGPERRGPWGNVRWDDGLLAAIGGEEMVRRVHLVFYDAVFDDPWIGQFFFGKPKSLLVDKQTEFMVSAFGGPHRYQGATPAVVHMHMFITDELSDLRERFLRRAILSQGLSEEIADRWLAVDRLFRPAVVKRSIEDCTLTTMGQSPIVAVKPEDYEDPTLPKQTNREDAA